jgi:hypothetical protein
LLRDSECPGVLDQLAHLVGVDLVETTWTQWYRRSDSPGNENFSGSDSTSASRQSLGNAKPITVPSREKGQVDDPADAELDAASHERLAAARKRARKARTSSIVTMATQRSGYERWRT